MEILEFDKFELSLVVLAKSPLGAIAMFAVVVENMTAKRVFLGVGAFMLLLQITAIVIYFKYYWV